MPTETIEQTLPLEGFAPQATAAPSERREVAAPQDRPPAARPSAAGGLSETHSVIAMLERLAKMKVTLVLPAA